MCECTLIKGVDVYLPPIVSTGRLTRSSIVACDQWEPPCSELSLCEEGGRCCRWRRLPFITSTSITIITSLPQHTGGRGRDAEKPSLSHSSTTSHIKTLTHFPLGIAMNPEEWDWTEVERGTWASNPGDISQTTPAGRRWKKPTNAAIRPHDNR